MANTTNLNLEKPIGTDQALVSVINSNMDKIDTFAGSTNQALSNLNNKMRIVSTGSLHDIRTAGVYWLTSGVTDKPEAGAGMYVLQLYGTDYIAGMYTVADNGNQYSVSYVGNVWTYHSIAKTNDFRLENRFLGNNVSRSYALTGNSTYILCVTTIGNGNPGNPCFGVIVTGASPTNSSRLTWLTSAPADGITFAFTDAITLSLTTTSGVWIDFALSKL